MSAQRDPWFDNAKIILVTLVVVGHAWTLLPDSGPTGGLDAHLYDFLYTWHMPAFVLVTGYLSRRFVLTRRSVWGLVRGLAVPYVILEAALALFRYWAGGEHLHHLWINPHWPLWYLPAVFFWRLATPLLRRSVIAIPVAVAASLAGGLLTTSTMDVSRILGFLPFYVIGIHLTSERIEALRTREARVLAVGVFVGVWVLSGHLRDWAGSGAWLYYNDTYASMDASASEGYVVRLMTLAAGLVAAAAFFALVPRARGWWTQMGAVTLVVYLCHGFFVKSLRYAGWGDFIEHLGVLGIVLTTLISVAIALFLASPPVSRFLSHVIDPFGYAEKQLDQAVEVQAIRVPDEVQAVERELALSGPSAARGA
ncbi:acyltransferase family protein [Nocardioides sp. Kera G14]|uniref:acyltransferase family protein n=1 Tax=Nocardioides sp. Kera G14 TaxID=2884264 RepID=UPI001D108718|nr:acyltransferase family protein [Nocardioides sp. Kera G14]UDY22740.1 acyltransferase family protein [Nocardioides sp. Kera G14]